MVLLNARWRCHASDATAAMFKIANLPNAKKDINNLCLYSYTEMWKMTQKNKLGERNA